jgi:hypothetical protein
LLHQLIPFTRKTVLYDNSGKTYRLFAAIENGKTVTLYDYEPLPKWYKIYVSGKLSI